MSSEFLKSELNFIDKKFQEYKAATNHQCKFEKYLNEMLQMDSIQTLIDKYKHIRQEDDTFTLCNVNDKQIKNVDSLKTTIVFCIEEKVSQALNTFRHTGASA
jgi:hypothetical protein